MTCAKVNYLIGFKTPLVLIESKMKFGQYRIRNFIRNSLNMYKLEEKKRVPCA
jgi:hypothetical protein